MSRPILSATTLEKVYKVYAKPWDRIHELVTRKSRHQAICALTDVSFELRPGESMGIIGQNGAGKSTLLSILAQVTSPSRGSIHVGGTVASLLELGMGFHPELTGRQNIRLNAAMMGLNEEQVDRLIPEIIAFSELGAFIDRPVKIYSTGMNMRLGFAIAVQVDPEILIVDEALSVGDGYFQKKCMDRVHRFVESGRTLLFCSHALYYVSAYCQKALWLEHGAVRALGPVEEVVREYENHLLHKTRATVHGPSVPLGDGQAVVDEGSGKLASILDLRQLNEVGEESQRFPPKTPWTLEVEWEAREADLQFHVGVGIDRIDGVQICTFGTHRDGRSPFTGRTQYTVRLEVAELPMLKGEYSLYAFLLDEQGLHVYDQEFLQTAFTIESSSFKVGLVEVDHSWTESESASK